MSSTLGVLMGVRMLTGAGVLAEMGVGSRFNRTGTASLSASYAF